MPITRANRRLHVLFPALIFSLFSTAVAHAAALLAPDCSATPTSLNCRLQGVLSFLYVAAAALGVILVIVTVLAIRYYRNNRRGPGGAQ